MWARPNDQITKLVSETHSSVTGCILNVRHTMIVLAPKDSAIPFKEQATCKRSDPLMRLRTEQKTTEKPTINLN
jgi:hypothetical protein